MAAYIILNMKTMVLNNDGLYDIIPYKASLSILYNKKIIFNDIFFIKYNLYESRVDKKKFNNAISFLMNKNIFPTKEHKGKKVIRYNNKIGHDPDSFRNFIKSLIFILKNYLNITPILVSSHNTNTMWVLNKLKNNKLVTTINYIDIPTIIINNIDLTNDCDIINDFCINYILNSKIEYNIESTDHNKVLDTILEYISIIVNNNL
ncbi:hypothetical protein AMV085 [Betaentomopoxvirus amoorei]|uniref:AMV085 n=1 Tax=Amsacta moorei entomopoxvirus TaxID=28321 RepID=Q9EMW4_AMEPV|nr:hypothetical protein AMV085 [Amsacta moorei entomopoxvirus]AAG02791.1 AMV085 [Amsacta moorei entomopoxvirus]